MANLRIEKSGSQILVRQCMSCVVLSLDQIDSVIKNLELARLEIRQAEFDAHRREEIRRLKAWDSERRSFDAVYVSPVSGG